MGWQWHVFTNTLCKTNMAKNINICHVKLEPHRSWSICSCFVSLKDCKWSAITYSANEFAWFLIDGEPPIKGKPPMWKIVYLTGKKSWNGNAQLQVHVNFKNLGIPNPTWSNRPDHLRPWKNQVSKHRQDTKLFKRFGATTLKGRVLCSCFLKGICST